MAEPGTLSRLAPSRDKVVVLDEPGCLVVILESYCPQCDGWVAKWSTPARAYFDVGLGALPYPDFSYRCPVERARDDVRNGEACSSYPVTAHCERSHSWPTLVRASFNPARKEATPCVSS